jgi:hypothetical protein
MSSESPLSGANSAAPAPSAGEIKRGDRAFKQSLLFSATRCTIQYVLLPFVLPFIGVAGAIGAAIATALSLIALGTVWFNVRDLWHTSWRYRYLGMALVMTVIIVIFLAFDVRALFA